MYLLLANQPRPGLLLKSDGGIIINLYRFHNKGSNCRKTKSEMLKEINHVKLK